MATEICCFWIMRYKKMLGHFYFWLLTRRYQVTQKGFTPKSPDKVRIYLPNHQAIVDPQLLVAFIHLHHNVSPIVAEEYYRTPLLKNLFQLLEAIPVKEPSIKNRDITSVDMMYESIFKALEHKKSLMIYPAGQISKTPQEFLGNKQAAWKIIGTLAERQVLGTQIEIIGVRINGFWGSIWSKAKNGKTPPFFLTFLKSIGLMFFYIWSFLPKRKISFTFENVTELMIQSATLSKREFNMKLESFYNQ